MRTSLFILVVNLGLLLPCCHSWGDEPESLADTQPPRTRLELSRTGDDSVRRVQASTTPSPGAGQPGTADTTLSQPGLAAATAAAAAGMETAGGFGELSSFGRGGRSR